MVFLLACICDTGREGATLVVGPGDVLTVRHAGEIGNPKLACSGEPKTIGELYTEYVIYDDKPVVDSASERRRVAVQLTSLPDEWKARSGLRK